MKTRLPTALILASVFSLANLVGPELDAQVVAAAPKTSAVHLSAQHPFDKLINSFAMDHVEKTEAGYVYWFFDKQFTGNGKTLKLSVVRPHEASHPAHHHVEDEFWFVIEGTAEFYIDGKTRVVGANTGVYAPSNVEHGLRNAGDGELKYLVIKQYPGQAH